MWWENQTGKKMPITLWKTIHLRSRSQHAALQNKHNSFQAITPQQPSNKPLLAYLLTLARPSSLWT
jgi:hypothetical protein